MDIDALLTISLLLASLFCAAILMRKYRRFFEWEKTDTWPTYWHRAQEEIRKDIEAQRTMFGSIGTTNRANFITFFALLGFVFVSTHIPVLSMAGLGYVAIGFFVSRRVAAESKTPGHERLLLADRVWFRLYFALGWPLWFWLRKNKTTDT